MNFLTTFFQQLYVMPFEQAVLWAVAGNIVMFVLSLLAGEWLVKAFHDRAITPPPPPVKREEIILALLCVVLNALVAAIGLAMWRAEIIVLRPDGGLATTLSDTLLLILMMDFGMYVFHRVAHHPILFPIIHLTHHKYENPRPLTLFVLNPFEVLGFGALLIGVIWISHASQLGIVLYLAFNLAFGMIGHLGVEPAPARWLNLPIIRYISTSTFHAEHHQDKDHNYGFYTVLWDRLFSTLSTEYLQDFGRATGQNVSK
ncbi:MAG: sterol desaturase family protein [Anaerolineae bacterium]